VKFRDLLSTAKDLGAKALVTGHYVKRVQESMQDEEGTPESAAPQLHRAYDKVRDQSYFLFTTTKEQLSYVHFPLGVFENKMETRYHAKRFGLNIADKPDSQDICFVPNGNYASVVSKLRPGALDPGEIVHMDGRVLGQHQGIINYTVGQRKGLGVSNVDPLYVLRLDAAQKQVIVGPREALATTRVALNEVNWLCDREAFRDGRLCEVKIRSHAAPVTATVQAVGENRALITFDYPEYGIAFGQAGVFYDGDRVLGGGWIARAENE
jgi:tRNA-specific 2-thiouridylase